MENVIINDILSVLAINVLFMIIVLTLVIFKLVVDTIIDYDKYSKLVTDYNIFYTQDLSFNELKESIGEIIMYSYIDYKMETYLKRILYNKLENIKFIKINKECYSKIDDSYRYSKVLFIKNNYFRNPLIILYAINKDNDIDHRFVILKLNIIDRFKFIVYYKLYICMTNIDTEKRRM